MKRILNVLALGVIAMSALSGCAGTGSTASNNRTTTIGLSKSGTSSSAKPDMWSVKGLTPPGGRQ